MKSRTPRSPPAAPRMILSLTASGAAVSCRSAWPSARLVSQATLPVSLSVAIMRGRIVRDGDDEIAPQRRAAVRERHLLLAGVHAPHDPAHVAGAAVDLVEHAPLVDDVEEAVLGERGRFQVLVRRGAADRDRIGELEVLDVRLVDLVERRVALRVIGAVVHQPVLRLVVGIDEPVRRHVGGEGAVPSRDDGAPASSRLRKDCEVRLHGCFLPFELMLFRSREHFDCHGRACPGHPDPGARLAHYRAPGTEPGE